MAKMFKDYFDKLTGTASEILDEALITFNKQAYPKFGNIVIMQGGAASGKGFVKNKLLGIEGWSFDPDELKELAMTSTILNARVKKELGIDMSSLNLHNPEDVRLLHTILSDLYNVDERFKNAKFASLAKTSKERLPNLIFDITAKSLSKVKNIHDIALLYGYKKENIHIVWVLDDVKAAVEKNKSRPRTVPEDILIQTHEGASLTAKKLLSMGDDLNKYMDGDYWMVFNRMQVDSTEVHSEFGGFYIKDATYFKAKSAGQSPVSPKDFTDDMYLKIKSYVPNIDVW